jgi:hypothetical protein
VTAANFPRLDIERDLRLALPFRLKLVEHVHNIDNFPKAIRHASGHCWRDFQRVVQPDEIVIHQVQRNRAGMVFDFLIQACLRQNYHLLSTMPSSAL